MSDLPNVVTGDRSISLRFQRLPALLRQRLRGAMEDVLPRLAAAQKARAPKGATGRLEAALGHVFIEEGTDFLRGRVTVVAPTGWVYGQIGALEYGAPGRRGRFMVREHKRRGRGIGMEVIVDRYYRTQRLMAMRFIRGPFEEMQGEIEEALAAAVDEAVKDSEAA
jgi:hypothetical protein